MDHHAAPGPTTLHAPGAMPGRVIDQRPRPRTILLATDLGPASTAAEAEAIELARDLRAALLVVSVVDPRTLRGARGEYLLRMDQARAALEARSRQLVERARGAGVATRSLIWEGEPAQSVLEAAIAESASMIVVGSHGRRGVDRLVLGSVSDQIVREARVPVVVARAHPAAAPDR